MGVPTLRPEHWELRGSVLPWMRDPLYFGNLERYRLSRRTRIGKFLLSARPHIGPDLRDRASRSNRLRALKLQQREETRRRRESATREDSQREEVQKREESAKRQESQCEEASRTKENAERKDSQHRESRRREENTQREDTQRQERQNARYQGGRSSESLE